MMEQLKPCPFCGETPYTMISGRENNVEIKIWCNKCHFGFNGYSKNELIAKWNRRAGYEDIQK